MRWPRHWVDDSGRLNKQRRPPLVRRFPTDSHLRDSRLTSPRSAAAQPQDIPDAALYLASDEAACVTGQALNVDGGVDVGVRGLRAFEAG